jgi:uncharacterized protein (UPF0262 family)
MSERIATLTLDEGSVLKRTPEIDHERTIAMTDLLHDNHFAPEGGAHGPYDVTLRIEEGRLAFDIHGRDGHAVKLAMPIQPLKKIIRDYFLICESYYAALKDSSPHKLEAIDMGRRGIHNEGSELLQGLLKDKVGIDFTTARRLFTLVCVLCLK